jgi:hypothetical protein
MDDLDGTLANLRKAIQFRDNMIKGESFPDPRHDDSFTKYVGDAKFQEAMKPLDEKK